MAYRPIIVLGAPRSGTNMLRDVLTALPGFATWPCDEINFVWKHGNITTRSDDIPPERAMSATSSFVRQQFDSVARDHAARYVVEKTCANTLRVAYVDKLLPDALFVVLLRDGRDAISSAMRRWQQPVPGGSYYLKKLRFVALTDMPWVLTTALARRLRGLIGSGKQQWSTWGPVFPELDAAIRQERPLVEVCALQWTRCVEQSLDGLEGIETSRWLVVSYERFVDQPQEQLRRVVSFTGASVDDSILSRAVRSVSADNVGKWRCDLEVDDLSMIEPLISEAMQRSGRLTHG
jgi:hypothetical protein